MIWLIGYKGMLGTAVLELLTANRVNLRIRSRFQTGHMLELNEAIISKENQNA